MNNDLSFGRMSPVMGNANTILSQPSALNQVGPSSASFQPGILPPPPNVQGAPGMPQAPQMASIPGAAPTPPQMPMQAPQAPVAPQAAPQQGVIGMPPGNYEAQMIAKALISRLASLSKGEEMHRGQQ